MRNRYDRQFKEEAVRLSEEIGVKRAAEQLGVLYHTLVDWRGKWRKHSVNAFVGSGRRYTHTEGVTPREIELQRENDELRRANDILKDALCFFAKDRKK
jgi:transposase